MKVVDEKGNRIIASKAVKEIFRALPIGFEFHGWELKERCVAQYPELEHVYVDTLLRRLRGSFHGCYEVVNASESLYKKTANDVHRTSLEDLEKYEHLKQQSFDFGEV